MFSFNNRKVLKTLIGCSLFLAVLANTNYHNDFALGNHIDINILRLLSSPPELFASEAFCSIKYVEELNIVLDNFKTRNDNCSAVSKEEKLAADKETLESRQHFATTIEESCNVIMQCNKNNKTVDMEYQCFILEGNNNSKVSQRISNEASTSSANYEYNLSIIRVNESVCTDSSKREFDEDADILKAKFHKCLENNEWPADPTPKPTTTSTTSAPQ